MEMAELETTHHAVADLFSNRGGYTYQTGHHRSFASIACDQTIEQTVNRHTKSQGGVIGFTLKPLAAQRWTTTHPERTATHEELRKLTEMDVPLYDHHGLTETSWKADEHVRVSMKEVIKARINPFSYDGKNLVNIVSGIEASPSVKNDIENAYTDGERKLKDFVDSRLKTQKVSFHAPIKASKSKTFSSMKIKPKPSANKILQCSGRLFDRLLVVSQQRNVDIKAVLSYSLGEISWTLTKPDGGLMKTNKADLVEAVEKDLSAACYVDPGQLTNVSSVILDGMAEIQCMKPPATFGELAAALLKRITGIALSYKCQRVEFVCDTYPALSIKGGERERRGTQKGTQRVTIFGSSQRVPVKYDEFLANGSNKEALAQFLHIEWSKTQLEQEIDVVIAFAKVCHIIKYRQNLLPECSQILNLSSNHEEADTRMFYMQGMLWRH